MRTPICERLGCDVPIFAFSHFRDIVVEVTKAGGLGVLGADGVWCGTVWLGTKESELDPFE